MPHTRNRYVIENITKKLSFSPVVTIQGARQTGKSFFVKNILVKDYPKLKYLTFDKSSDRDFATSNPDTFLEQHIEARPLILDEAQKVPEIFDAIKFSVDNIKIPSRYLLLGSTEFSRLHKIRESLTGRISKARLYPFTISESLNQPISNSKKSFFINHSPTITRSELMRFLTNGGFPGIFFVHNKTERDLLINDWLELTTERDIHQFSGLKLDSQLCQRILQGVALLEHPDQASIAKYCRRDGRVIKRHLEALVTLFVLNKLEPHPSGGGKSIYFLCDVSLATFLGAEFRRQLSTWALNELLAKQSYKGLHQRKYFYYKTIRGSIIDFIEEDGDKVSAIKIHDQEKVTSKNFYLLQSFKSKFKNAEIYLLGSDHQKWKDFGVTVLPWETLG